VSESNLNHPHGSTRFSVVVARPRWVGFTTFIVRAYKDIVTNFVLTIAPPAVTTALYLIVFGSFIGERIGNIDGIRYQQYMVPGLVLLPIIAASYSQAGLSFVVAKLYKTIDEHLVSPQPSWIIVVSYVVGVVFLLPRLFRDLKPLNLKYLSLFWNFGLFAFSLCVALWGMYVSYFVYQYDGFRGLICDSPGFLWNGAPLFVIYVFLISKYVELGDTVFLAVKKKQIPFLHWYHHFTVLLYCLIADSTKSSLAWLFGVMNAVVHCFMYWYYFQATQGVHVWWGKLLTIAQTSQMIIGMGLTSVWAYFEYGLNSHCSSTNPTIIFGASVLMYGSYLMLFIQFYFSKYETKEKPSVADGEKKKH